MIDFAARFMQAVSSTTTGGLPGPAQIARLPVFMAAGTSHSLIVWSVRTLADNLNALSRTVAEVNTGLRQRLALDQPEAEGPPALPGPADPEAPAEPAGAGRRNGRKARAD